MGSPEAEVSDEPFSAVLTPVAMPKAPHLSARSGQISENTTTGKRFIIALQMHTNIVGVSVSQRSKAVEYSVSYYYFQ